DDEQLVLTVQPAADQILEQPFDHGGILGGPMPQTQYVLFAVHINAHGRYQTIPAEEFAVDHQHQKLPGYGPLHQLLQLPGRGSFPMPTDAGFTDPIAFQTTIDGSGVVARRALARQLSGHGLLQLALALKALITAKADFLLVRAAQSWPLQLDLAPSEDH